MLIPARTKLPEEDGGGEGISVIKKLAVQKESAFKGSFKTRLKIKLPQEGDASSCSHAPWVGWADIHAFFHKSDGQKRSACPVPSPPPSSDRDTALLAAHALSCPGCFLLASFRQPIIETRKWVHCAQGHELGSETDTILNSCGSNSPL